MEKTKSCLSTALVIVATLIGAVVAKGVVGAMMASDERASDFSTTVTKDIETKVIGDICVNEPKKKNMRAGGEFEYRYTDEACAQIANFPIARTTSGI